MTGNKGFTIIELIVVIAIIAVLAAIVLVNVTQYIAKGKDAAIEGNMATLMITAVTLYDINETYIDFCADNFVTGKPLFDQDPSADANKKCNETDAEWAACSQMFVAPADYWCVDGAGIKKQVVGTCDNDWVATACP